MAKPTRAEVNTLLAAAAVTPAKGLVQRVDSAAGLLFISAHGFSLGDELELELVRDTTTGAPTPDLPGTLAEATTYEAVPVSENAFRLRLPSSSTITSFTDAGTGRFKVVTSAWADLDAAIDRAWRFVNTQCTAHGGDVEAGVVTDMAAALAANMYADQKAAGDPANAATYAPAKAVWTETYAPYLARLFAGVPVKGATDATPTVSEGSPSFKVLGPAAPAGTSWGTSSSEVV